MESADINTLAKEAFHQLSKQELNQKIRQMMFAARLGLTDKLEELLAIGININSRSDVYYYAIIQAASNNNLETTRAVIQHGAIVDAVDNLGTTSLMLTDDTEVAKLLIKSGANINHKSLVKNTPLICHSYKNNVEIIKELLSQGAALEDRNQNGNTALCTAILEGSVEATLLLIESGADYQIINNDSETIFDLARQSKHQEMIHIISSIIENQKLKNAIQEHETKGNPFNF